MRLSRSGLRNVPYKAHLWRQSEAVTVLVCAMSAKIDVFVWYLMVVASLGVARADYRGDGGFMPSPSYRTEDQLAEPSARVDKREDRDNQPERTQRFGISTYGNGEAQGPYGASSPGLYGPVKIDLGGVLIGTMLGFGAVIILPKLIQALSYGYGGYGRSLETDFSQLSEMLSKLEETMSRYNIDSAACMQRVACSYVQLANENVISGNATDFDAVLANLTNNSLIRRMLDGTSIFEAVSAGRSLDSNCEALYPKCKLDKKAVVKMLTQIVPT